MKFSALFELTLFLNLVSSFIRLPLYSGLSFFGTFSSRDIFFYSLICLLGGALNSLIGLLFKGILGLKIISAFLVSVLAICFYLNIETCMSYLVSERQDISVASLLPLL